MAEIIDLDFYRKFRVILPIRGVTKQQVIRKDQPYGHAYQAKPFRRKRKTDGDPKVTKKD